MPDEPEEAPAGGARRPDHRPRTDPPDANRSGPRRTPPRSRMDTLRATPPEWMTAAEVDRWYRARDRPESPWVDFAIMPLALLALIAAMGAAAGVWLLVAWLFAR